MLLLSKENPQKAANEFYEFQPWQTDWQARFSHLPIAMIRQQYKAIGQSVSIQQSSQDSELMARLSRC